MADLWTYKDKVVAPTVVLTTCKRKYIRRIVFFCGFPVFRYYYEDDTE